MSFPITNNNSTLFPFKNHCHEVYKPKHGVLNKKLLEPIFGKCEVMLSLYSKVFVVRIDLHPKHYSANNQKVSEFLQASIKKIKKQYKCKVQYLCAREQLSSEKQHHHAAFLLSGHKLNYPSKLLSQIKTAWEKQGLGIAKFVSNSYCMMLRGNRASIKPAIYRLSYLAKNYSKELNGKAKSLLMNRIKPSHKFDANDDTMFVNPDITFEQNKKRETYQRTAKQQPPAKFNTSIKSRYGWKDEPTHAEQLKECIATRTSSLTHLMEVKSHEIVRKSPYLYKDVLIH